METVPLYNVHIYGILTSTKRGSRTFENDDAKREVKAELKRTTETLPSSLNKVYFRMEKLSKQHAGFQWKLHFAERMLREQSELSLPPVGKSHWISYLVPIKHNNLLSAGWGGEGRKKRNDNEREFSERDERWKMRSHYNE